MIEVIASQSVSFDKTTILNNHNIIMGVFRFKLQDNCHLSMYNVQLINITTS